MSHLLNHRQLLTIALSVALATAAAGLGAQSAEAAKPMASKPMALRSVMEKLGRDMQAVTGAISKEEWTLVAELAPKIAKHAEPPLGEKMDAQPTVAEYVKTHSLMLALVAAGYGVGFSSAAHLAGCHQADVVVRPLGDETASLTTYLLRPEGEVMEPLRQFIDRVERVGRPQGADQRPM